MTILISQSSFTLNTILYSKAKKLTNLKAAKQINQRIEFKRILRLKVKEVKL